MRFYHFSIFIFLAVTVFVLQFFSLANAEDVFARPSVFGSSSSTAPVAPVAPTAAAPTYIIVPAQPAAEAKKADPNMPREVFLDAGPAAADVNERHPSAHDEDDEGRYYKSKKKKHSSKHSDEEGSDDFVEVN
jgi:hypothetical protein